MANQRRRRIKLVFERLGGHYGIPQWHRRASAIDQLIETILSQNTNDKNSAEGFRRLKAKFPDWASVENAPWQSVAAAIRVSGLANIKSRRIKATLKRIREDRGGSYSLEFLKKRTPASARQYLLAIPGVGPKTAACVLVFSFGMPVFPVDTHIHRVSKRLDLIDDGTGAAAAHDELQKLVPDNMVYPFHMLVIQHGRTTCHARKPECNVCVLKTICPYGKRSSKDA